MKTIAVLVGSLREGSFSRKLAHTIVDLAPTLSFDIVEIGDLSYFSEDLEAAPPADWVAYRARIEAADAVLFITPEYVRSVPGVLKNAIDIGSRPYGEGVLVGKPAAVISTSLGAIGGFGANHHLRQSLASLDMPTLGQPEAYIGHTGELFDEEGRLANDDTRAFLQRFVKAFDSFVEGWTARRDMAHKAQDNARAA